MTIYDENTNENELRDSYQRDQVFCKTILARPQQIRIKVKRYKKIMAV